MEKEQIRKNISPNCNPKCPSCLGTLDHLIQISESLFVYKHTVKNSQSRETPVSSYILNNWFFCPHCHSLLAIDLTEANDILNCKKTPKIYPDEDRLYRIIEDIENENEDE